VKTLRFDDLPPPDGPAAAPLLVPAPHPATLSDADLLAQCDVARGRSGGPGGQHRNKVETKITLHHTPTGIDAQAGERRSAAENAAVALRRLRLVLAVAARAPVPPGESRSELWLRRCPERAGGRITCNPDHHDYPALLAEALDTLESCALDMRRAAARLCCSPSQLTKLIKDHPPALVRLNARRAAAGDHPLH